MTPAIQTPLGSVYVGDALAVLRELPSDSVDCVVTSPPYFALRDYGVDGQIGLEQTPQEWVARLVDVFREVRRVLKPTGVAWVNCGDSYVTSRKGPGSDDKSTLTPSGVRYQRSSSPGPGRTGSHAKHGQERSDIGLTAARRGRLGDIKPKDLIGQPWMLAFALRADGWYLRQEVIWHKPDAYPESVRDRPTRAHEQVFLLSKSPRYFYDADAIAEPVSESTHARVSQNVAAQVGRRRANGGSKTNGPMKAVVRAPKTQATEAGQGIRNNDSFGNAIALTVTRRNARTVWSIGTAGYKGSHFAVYPEELVERCVKAGTSAAGVCAECGVPWVRETDVSYENVGNRRTNGRKGRAGVRDAGVRGIAGGVRLERRSATTGWARGCEHGEYRCDKCAVVLEYGREDRGAQTPGRDQAVSHVPTTIHGQSMAGESKELLLADVPREVDREESQDDEGLRTDQSRLSGGLRSKPSISDEERVHPRTPSSGRGASRPETLADRSSPSRERTETRQSNRESAGDGKARTRSTREDRHGDRDELSELRSQVRPPRACAVCSGPLTFAPFEPVPATVLDCFLGSGTTAQVSLRLGRRVVGIELNPGYLSLIERRMAAGEMERSRGGDGALIALPVSDLGPLWTTEIERECVSKQDAVGKRTYVGFNARWKRSQRERMAGDA